MKKLNKEAEAKVLEAIQDICTNVQGGDSPTDAVVKVAQERKLTPNFIKLACHGYNTGATAFQREKGDTVLSKFAEFPLADATDVIGRVFPKEPEILGREKDAQAISGEYGRAPVGTAIEKVAHMSLDGLRIEVPESTEDVVLDHKAALRFKTANAEIARMNLSLSQKRGEYVEAQDMLLGELGRLADHVKRSDAVEPDDVVKAAESRFGLPGRHVGRFVQAHVTKQARQKRASSGSLFADWNSAPWTMVTEAVKQAGIVIQLRDEYRTMSQAVVEKEAEFRAPFVEKAREDAILVKEAAPGFFSGALMMGAVPKAVSALAAPKDNASLRQGAMDDIMDSDTENAIRAAQTQSTASQLLDDEIIGGYDQDEVLTAFNEISQLAPRASSQPLVMRALLRKRLTQGALEPFEATEIAGLEKTISESQNPRLTFDKEGNNVLAGNTVI